VKTDPTGQIQKREERPADKMVRLIKGMTTEIAKALPRHVSPDRMARIITTAIRINPRLAECTPVSFIGAVIQSSQLGLEPNTLMGHSYLVPFFNKKALDGKGAYECQLIVGYMGYVELAYRSNLVSKIIAREVRAGDEFEYAYGTDDYIRHVPSNDPDRESQEITHTYAIVKIKGGDTIFTVLTKADIEARRARSASAKKSFSPWLSDYPAMARKSAIRALRPYIPQSSELAMAESLEHAHEIGETQILNPEITEVLERQGLVVEEQSDEPPADVETVTDKK
jgi:recombination protein RecT